MVVPDGVVQGQRLVALAPRVAGPGIAIDDDGRHAELTQPSAESDATRAAAKNHRIRLRDMAELFGFAPALLEPRLPIRDGAMLGPLWSPVMLWLFIALEIVQCRLLCLCLAVYASDMT